MIHKNAHIEVARIFSGKSCKNKDGSGNYIIIDG